jgi:hypothetical protein
VGEKIKENIEDRREFAEYEWAERIVARMQRGGWE